MTNFEILFWAGLAIGGIAFLYLLLAKDARGSAALAAATSATLLAYTVVTVAQEGITGFYANHSANFWGIQVWYDLIIALAVSLFLLAPRAKAQGISPVPYIILTSFTGSIGMLALLARVMMAERRATA